jgi:hypothetical protein
MFNLHKVFNSACNSLTLKTIVQQVINIHMPRLASITSQTLAGLGILRSTLLIEPFTMNLDGLASTDFTTADTLFTVNSVNTSLSAIEGGTQFLAVRDATSLMVVGRGQNPANETAWDLTAIFAVTSVTASDGLNGGSIVGVAADQVPGTFGVDPTCYCLKSDGTDLEILVQNGRGFGSIGNEVISWQAGPGALQTSIAANAVRGFTRDLLGRFWITDGTTIEVYANPFATTPIATLTPGGTDYAGMQITRHSNASDKLTIKGNGGNWYQWDLDSDNLTLSNPLSLTGLEPSPIDVNQPGAFYINHELRKLYFINQNTSVQDYMWELDYPRIFAPEATLQSTNNVDIATDWAYGIDAIDDGLGNITNENYALLDNNSLGYTVPLPSAITLPLTIEIKLNTNLSSWSSDAFGLYHNIDGLGLGWTNSSGNSGVTYWTEATIPGELSTIIPSRQATTTGSFPATQYNNWTTVAITLENDAGSQRWRYWYPDPLNPNQLKSDLTGVLTADFDTVNGYNTLWLGTTTSTKSDITGSYEGKVQHIRISNTVRYTNTAGETIPADLASDANTRSLVSFTETQFNTLLKLSNTQNALITGISTNTIIVDGVSNMSTSYPWRVRGKESGTTAFVTSSNFSNNQQNLVTTEDQTGRGWIVGEGLDVTKVA